MRTSVGIVETRIVTSSGQQPDPLREALEKIGSAIALSSHALAQAPRELPSQLHGRLAGYDNEHIKSFLAQAREQTQWPWLRPMRASLATPESPLLGILVGHRSEIQAIASVPGSSLVVSGSPDGTIRVWDLSSHSCIRKITGPFDRVYAVAVTPDGRHIVAGTNTKFAYVYALATGHLESELGPHEAAVPRIVITSDGSRCCCLSGGGLQVWDMESGRLVRTISDFNEPTEQDDNEYLGAREALVLSAAGIHISLAITPDDNVIGAVYDGGLLQVWDLDSGECVQTLKGHAHPANAVAVSADGRRAVSIGLDLTLKVWDLKSGTCIRSIDLPADDRLSLALTHDGKRCITGPGDDRIYLWDLESGECVGAYGDSWIEVCSMAISDDGRSLLAGVYERIEIYDLDRPMDTSPQGPPNEIGCVQIDSTDGQRAFSLGGDMTLRSWGLLTGQCNAELIHGETGRTNAALGPTALSEDGQLAVSSTEQYVLKTWDIGNDTCRILRTCDGYAGAIAFLPGEERVAVGSDAEIEILDFPEGACVQSLSGHAATVTAISACQHNRLATGSNDGNLRLWNLSTGQCEQSLFGKEAITDIAVRFDDRVAITNSYDGVLRIWDLATSVCRRVLRTDNRQNDICLAEGHPWVASCTKDGKVAIWDFESGKLLHKKSLPLSFRPVRFSSDDCSLIIASHRAPDSVIFGAWQFAQGYRIKLTKGIRHVHARPSNSRRDHGCRWIKYDLDEESAEIWDCETGEFIASQDTHRIGGRALTNDARFLLFASSDYSIRVWDQRRAEVRIFPGHPAKITATVLSPDGDIAVTGDEAGTVKIWDVPTATCLHELDHHDDSVDALAISPCGRLLASGSDDCTIRVYALDRSCAVESVTKISSAVFELAFDKSGDRLLCRSMGNREAVVTLIDRSKATEILKSDEIFAAEFTSSGDEIVIASRKSERRTVGLWSVAKKSLIRVIAEGAEFTKLALTPDDRKVAALVRTGNESFEAGDEILRVSTLTADGDDVTFRADAPGTNIAYDAFGNIVVGGQDGAVHLLKLVNAEPDGKE